MKGLQNWVPRCGSLGCTARGHTDWNCRAQGFVQALLPVMEMTQPLVAFRLVPLALTAQLKDATAAAQARGPSCQQRSCTENEEPLQ